jgi:hypothetical protein
MNVCERTQNVPVSSPAVLHRLARAAAWGRDRDLLKIEDGHPNFPFFHRSFNGYFLIAYGTRTLELESVSECVDLTIVQSRRAHHGRGRK